MSFLDMGTMQDLGEIEDKDGSEENGLLPKSSFTTIDFVPYSPLSITCPAWLSLQYVRASNFNTTLIYCRNLYSRIIKREQ